jgi:hypothetical protein
MKEYSEALRAWFLKRAFIPSYYGMGRYPEEEETADFKNHVKRCRLVWLSEPRLDSVKGFDGAFAEDVKVPGIAARLGCSCDEYVDCNAPIFFIPGQIALGDLIAQVVAEGER